MSDAAGNVKRDDPGRFYSSGVRAAWLLTANAVRCECGRCTGSAVPGDYQLRPQPLMCLAGCTSLPPTDC